MSGYTVYSSTSVTATPNTAGHKKDSIDPYILHLCLNSDKTKVLTASCRNQLQVYDQNTLEFQQLLSGHTDTINVLECSKLNPFIVYSGSSDNTAHVWDLRQNNNHVSNNHGPINGSYIQQKRLKYEVKALSVSFNDSLMAVGAQSSARCIILFSSYFCKMRDLAATSSSNTRMRVVSIGPFL